ncbi:MAG: SAM-dependent methyltransferase [Cyanobium sp.]|nr:MAG: SAM-dependent methyltransferase [Cyanobium sp.]
MQEAGWVVVRSGKELIERQERYREALEALTNDDDAPLGFTRLDDLLVEHLGWDPGQLSREADLIAAHSKDLPELGETLTPTALVPAARGEGAQLLVMELPLLTPLDQKATGGEQLWRATAQERFERLLRETGVEAGLLFNGSQLRLVVAPKGESSGHLSFTLTDLAEVGGRLLFSGLDLLLGQSHVFLDPDGYRLADVLKKSRSFQAVVSNALADQVLAALWELLRGFERADQLSQKQGQQLLGALADEHPEQLYGGLITELMRLVFLLYAEDDALMPSDAVYEQNYKVSGVFERLQQDAAEFPDTMEQRYGAWAGLMSICRLVFDGGGPSTDYLPARHGQLFDPAVYPWLETPWISDGVVHGVLSNLLTVKGERISYRALDVEQIGSVYEGIMGYAVRRIDGRSIGIKSKPQGAKKQLTTAVDLDALLKLEGSKRKNWLIDEAHTAFPAKAVWAAKATKALNAASKQAELLDALAPLIDQELFDSPREAGSLVFQPTEERRRSGSHYTPRSLTRPIVAEALRPWLERTGPRPSAVQILALKICDPAMGSGAFLVESCRYLAELLEQAWNRDGFPEALLPGGVAHGEEPLLYARRLIAQGCLYGVDKNPFAVNLARLSLWLVSLSKDAPFTFVDHSLKCGDSLVGMSRAEIEAALKGATLQRELWEGQLKELLQQEQQDFELFHADSRSDADDDRKREALKQLQSRTAFLRTTGDLLVAAFFNGSKPKDREELKKIYLAETVTSATADELEAVMKEPLERLRYGEKGITPLHWQLEFPDVFGRQQAGFDVFVGNPPFVGGRKVKEVLGEGFQDWLQHYYPESSANADLSSYFFLRCFSLLRTKGALGLIATKTIAQGDTRSTGLRWICLNGGTIFAARKRYKWPGVAAVVVSVVHLLKGTYEGEKLLNRQPVQQITAFLFDKGGHEDPKPLAANASKSFQGSIVLGMGFTFDDSGPADDDTPGIPSPIATMERLIAENPKNAEVIFPYIGGEEVNSSPSHSHHRFVIDFRDRNEGECHKVWPELMEIMERKVKPERTRKRPNGEFALRSPLPQRWWHHSDKRPALYAAIASCQRVLVTSAAAVSHHMINSVRADSIFSHKLIVFPEASSPRHMCQQSLFHEEWSRAFGSTQGSEDAYTYNPSHVFLGYPFPLGDSLATEFALGYSASRANHLEELGLGPTSAYGKLHQPSESSLRIREFRAFHDQANQEVAVEYGWADVDMSCGFALDYLNLEENVVLPSELQERIDSGDLFFQEAEEACAFQGQLQAITGSRKKLPWRYRWPDEVRDDVLARLLALNAERYAEELALGVPSKGGKPAGPTAPAGKRRGRPPKAAGPADAQQIGLAL